MKPFVPRPCLRRWCAAAAALALPFAAARADGLAAFFGRLLDKDIHVITVTDKTPAGRLIREPDRQNPLYYELLVVGYRDFGRGIAGLHVPPKREMLKLIFKLLADQGYYPANAQHKPEILIAVGWGTINGRPGIAVPFMGGDKLDLLWEFDAFPNVARWQTRFMRSQTAEFVWDCAQEDLYVISIQAFDEQEALQGRAKPLWHTKVSCPSAGLAFAPSIKEMARQAAPYIGRETGQPVWTIAPPRRGQVDLGELKVLEMIDPDKLPVTDVDQGPDAVGPEAAARRQAAGAR